ncbi:MAG: radical SAM protein [Bacteroidales bacterium]|nr:radical SAM protein [Bacteroidales bacterium]
MRHYNIPIFIPELACPHRCVFCNQSYITGQSIIPKCVDIQNIITQYLSTIPSVDSVVQVAFFGGSFTGLPLDVQRNYLQAALQTAQDRIDGIRISTRPDYITPEIVKMLVENGVTHVELGAQSMDAEVLKLANRGHEPYHVIVASQIILDAGLVLGLQMMIGLPEDTRDKALNTAEQIVKLGAKETRIYPTLVIRDTALANWWKQGRYKPLSLDEAVDLSATLCNYFNQNQVTVLRTGLYPSEDLNNGSGFLAGPFHPNFNELVMSLIWRLRFEKIVKPSPIVNEVFLAANKLNHAIGFKKSNKQYFNQKNIIVNFSMDNQLKGDDFYVDYR